MSGDCVEIKLMRSECCGFGCPTVGLRASSSSGKYQSIVSFVDFVCADAKLIVEIDGGQHDQNRQSDAKRTEVLEAMGYMVLRFWNHDVLRNTEGVLDEMLNTIKPERL